MVTLDIPQKLKGKVTPFDLLNSVGTISFWVELRAGENPLNGYLFSLVHDDYYFQAGISNDNLYIQRDRYRTSIQLTRPQIVDRVLCIVIWSPTELQVMALDNTYKIARDGGADAEMEVEKRTKRMATPATYAPNSLLNWARKQAIIPTLSYTTRGEFYEAVSVALDMISDKVKSCGMHNPFWDITYKGLKVVTRKPKRETDIHPTIRGLLSDIALVKNLEVIPEYSTAGGNLDFLVSAKLQNGETVYACLEFKHAHSKDLEKGLTIQLPAYMKAKGADYGQYCVMYFKGKDFDKPAEYATHQKLHYELSRRASQNIIVRIFDFSRSATPSQPQESL